MADYTDLQLFRVQDRHGRGPWRPGFSHKWLDQDRDFSMPAIFEEVPDLGAKIADQHAAGLHVGCAVRGLRSLWAWFTQAELARLRAHGFRVVSATRCAVIAETKHQVLIASQKPLSSLPRILWPDVLA